MSNKEELRDQLIHYFRAVGSGQNMIQCIKQVLFLHERFNPVLIFEKLSKGKQRISTKNWRDYLVSINLQFNERQFKYFMKHNQYKSQVTLNEFLESIIPYNGDVVRQYKQKCSQSIRINEPNKEIDYIFAELIENEFKLFRILINIRDAISSIASLKDILELVKRDLLNDLQKNNLARQHRKLQETFQNKDFKLGFSQLRKFFKVWVPQKVIVHELCMLNVMRHLKSNDPFCKIIFKKRRYHNKNNDLQAIRRSRSRSRQQSNDQSPYGSQQKRNPLQNQSPYSKHLMAQDSKDKYLDFKDKILNEFQENKKQALYRQPASSSKKQRADSSYKKTPKQSLNEKYSADKQFYCRQPEFGQENVIDSSHKQRFQHKKSTPIKGEYILKFLQEIIAKEEKLQRLRKQLAKNNDFNLINLYKLMDIRNKGYITSRDVSQFSQFQKGQYYDMVNFYGREKDKLLFHQFCEIFRPLSKQLNEAIDSRPQNKISDPFKRQTRRLILQILNTTGQFHFNLQKMRQGMRRINPKSMFTFLDVHNKGYLDSDTLLTVFKEQNIYCDDKSLKCLMKLFRKRIQERVTFNEFAKFIEA